MHDALLVGGLERVGDLLRDRHGILDRQGTLCDPIGERDAVDELHDDGVP